MGLYQISQLQLYTNVGLGVIGPPVRFLCPPEVTLLTLYKDRTYSGVTGRANCCFKVSNRLLRQMGGT